MSGGRPKKILSDQLKEQILYLYGQGWSMASIAKELDIGLYMVRKLVKT